MDHFKHLNDTYGHPIGDEVLRRLATVLLDVFRQTDVVARWGGEEFLIGLYDSHKLDAVRRLELAQEEFGAQAIALPGGEAVRATFSAGVAEFVADGQNLEELYRAADAALYLAKAAGRARVLPTP
jgi:diguanylate cyclase (GGDEF)-like protein